MAARARGDWQMLTQQASGLVGFELNRLRESIPRWLTRQRTPDEFNDLLSAGYEAAYGQVRSWDPLISKFSTHVCRRVRGALIDALKRITGGVVGGRDTPTTNVRLQFTGKVSAGCLSEGRLTRRASQSDAFRNPAELALRNANMRRAWLHGYSFEKIARAIGRPGMPNRAVMAAIRAAPIEREEAAIAAALPPGWHSEVCDIRMRAQADAAECKRPANSKRRNSLSEALREHRRIRGGVLNHSTSRYIAELTKQTLG